MPKILVVDDEAALREALSYTLRREGHVVATAEDGPGALERAASFGPDVVILDVMLPGIDGIEVCRRLRATSSVPIVLLTARDQIGDRVSGFDVGADDYVTKPFNSRELVARVAAVLARQKRARELLEQDRALVQQLSAMTTRLAADLSDSPGAVSSGELVVDPASGSARHRGKPLDLGPAELRLLHLLVANAGRVVTRTEALGRIWPDQPRELALLDATIRILREKLGDDPVQPRAIVTVAGIGFVWSSS